jgi:type I restriction enzyme M protein
LIKNTYHNWRKNSPLEKSTESGVTYKDIKGFCKSATIEEIEKHNHVLTPGRYVGIEVVEDDGISFETKMAALTTTLKQQMDKEAELNNEIATQFSKIGLTL